jgi:hypothetical protein
MVTMQRWRGAELRGSKFAAPATAETAQRLQKMCEEGRLQEAGNTL